MEAMVPNSLQSGRFGGTENDGSGQRPQAKETRFPAAYLGGVSEV